MLKILWVAALVATSVSRPVYATEPERLALCDVLTGVAVVDGLAVVSGARSNVLRSQGLVARDFVNGPNCVAAAAEQWDELAVPIKAAWTDVLENEAGLWLLGHEQILLNSEDLGATWRSMQLVGDFAGNPQQAFMDLLLPTSVAVNRASQNIYAVGTRGLYATSKDGGVHWQQQVLYVDPEWDEPEDFNLNAIVELKDGGFLVAGEAGAVYWSKDGEHWDKDFAGSEATWFGAVAMPNGGALLYGFGGKLAYTKGFEEDWQLLEVGTASLFSSVLLDSGDLLLAGQRGELLRWSGDVSQSFLKVPTGMNATITGMAVLGSSLLLTTDHGLWSVPFSLVKAGG